jgi:flagellar hook assembly protein FlgD
MRRIVIMFIVALVAGTAFAGGQPEAPEVGVGEEGVAYISPETSPGAQDELTIPISVGEIGGNNVVVAYRLEIRNASGNVVWVESAVDESEDPGFFGTLLQNLGLAARQTTVEIPERTSWDGTYQGSDAGSDGEPVPDGEYTYVMTVTDNREVTATSEPREVVVDNTLPQATASINYDVFSPNGDGNRDTVTLTQETSSEDEWLGQLERDGTVVYDETWTGEAAERFVWRGRNPAGEVVEDGEYMYTLSATDRAGNTGSIDPIAVIVDTAPRPLDLAASTTAFSPNGDGTKDTVELTFGDPSLERLESAVISVTGPRGREVGSVEVGERIAERVTLTGYLDQARTERAPEGTYEVSATATYGNGTVSEAGPVEITLDVTPPSGTVRVSDDVFSPEGDGNKDTIRVIHDVSDDASWTGYVYVAGDEVLESFRFGTDVPSAVVWDGTDLEGDDVPDGTYSYSLIGTDPAGNQYETDEVRVTIDRRPTLVDLFVSRQYFSPNGDGEGDTVLVRPQLSVWDGIAQYSFRILNEDGETVLSGTGEEGPIPREIPWDGLGADGEVLPEGEYVGVLDLVYEKGNRPQGVTPVVTIDTTIPDVALRASSTTITPNDDGENDTIRFIPFVDPANEIVRYRGQIQAMDGGVVAELTGTRPVGHAVWDGTTMRGTVAPDGSYVASLEVEHRNGTVRRAQTRTIALSTVEYEGAPQVALRMSPQPFSPDGDGRADTLSVTVAMGDDRPIAEWSVSVREPDGDVFFEYSGEGEPVRSFEWDGYNDAGERVTMATDYEVFYEVTDAMGNTTRGSETLTIDILTVERYGMRKIDLPDIIFEGYTTRYLNWNKELSERNVRVLDQIAAALEKFPRYDVELHGHAVSVLYYDEELSDLEHEQTLIPLSRGRSETILDAMVSRGLEEDRFALEWWGKLRPLVPFSNLEERFVDRRVEFYVFR